MTVVVLQERRTWIKNWKW